MKKIGVLIAAISIVLFFIAAESFAAKGTMWRGSGGWGMGGAYHKMFDPKTVETISGDVVRVDRITPMKGMSTGIHLVVKTEKEEISVRLGPAWFVENQDIKIEPNDKIEVKGSRVTFQGKPALIAEEVKKGDETLALRDETGVPLWSGMRRR